MPGARAENERGFDQAAAFPASALHYQAAANTGNSA